MCKTMCEFILATCFKSCLLISRRQKPRFCETRVLLRKRRRVKTLNSFLNSPKTLRTERNRSTILQRTSSKTATTPSVYKTHRRPWSCSTSVSVADPSDHEALIGWFRRCFRFATGQSSQRWTCEETERSGSVGIVAERKLAIGWSGCSPEKAARK